MILSMWWLEMGAVAGILGIAGASISVIGWPSDLDLAVSVRLFAGLGNEGCAEHPHYRRLINITSEQPA